jgi:hypothetical protein
VRFFLVALILFVQEAVLVFDIFVVITAEELRGRTTLLHPLPFLSLLLQERRY